MARWNNEAVSTWIETGNNSLYRILDATTSRTHYLSISPNGEYVLANRSEPGGTRQLVAFRTATAEEAWRLEFPDRLSRTWFTPDARDLILAFENDGIQRHVLETGRQEQEFELAFKAAPEVFLPTQNSWYFAGPGGSVTKLAKSEDAQAAATIQRGNGTAPSFVMGTLNASETLLALSVAQPEIYLLDAEDLELKAHIKAELKDRQFEDTYYRLTFSKERPEVVQVHGRKYTRQLDISTLQELPLKNAPARGGGSLLKHEPERRLVQVKLGAHPHLKELAVVPPAKEAPPDFYSQEVRIASSDNDLHLAVSNETGTIVFASAASSKDHPLAQALEDNIRHLDPPPKPVSKTNPVQRRPQSARANGTQMLLWGAREAEATEYREAILVAVRGTPEGDLRLYCSDEDSFEIRRTLHSAQALDRSTAEKWTLRA